MHFSVIYEFDIPMGHSVNGYTPKRSRAWQLTEQSDGEPSEWCAELFNGKVKHRKWCGLLDKEQFKAFVQDTGIFAEDVETVGSLGAPGCGYGIAPAVSFRSDDPEAIQCAYVTPLPDVERKRELTPERGEQVWRRVRQAMLSMFR